MLISLSPAPERVESKSINKLSALMFSLENLIAAQLVYCVCGDKSVGIGSFRRCCRLIISYHRRRNLMQLADINKQHTHQLVGGV